MAIRLTVAQRLILADCTRAALVGWLITDPQVSQKARRMEHQATTISGFSFSRFASAALKTFGGSYHARSPVNPDRDFPLSIETAIALANDIELDMADTQQLHAAALIAAFSPYGQPEVGTRDWRTYVSTLNALGVFMDEGHPAWRAEVRATLSPFRASVLTAVAAE